jgi:RimJ/RimL family protein N-acetyltransferase
MSDTPAPGTHSINDLGQPLDVPVPGWAPPPVPPRTAMVGRTCRVEPIDIDRHAADLHEANLIDPAGGNWTYLPYGPFHTLKAYRTWMEEACLGDDPLFHAVIDLETGKAAGIASYLNINPAFGSIEVGHIHFSPLLQHRPAATEAMYLMMKRAFELGYRRYEWKCNALNTASRRAAMRLGLSYEGVFRQMMVVKGHNRNSAWYAAIDGEWPLLDEAFSAWLAPQNFDGEGKQVRSLSDMTRPILVQVG